MKYRLTFIIPPNTPHPASPEQFHLNETSLRVSNLHAAREDRFNLQLGELPEHVRGFFEELVRRDIEMIVRWTGSEGYESVEPFIGRVTSGLNILLKGKKVEGMKQDGKDVCDMAKKVFGEGAEGCESVSKSFVRLPGDRYHFYSPMGGSGLKGFTEYIVENLSSDCKKDIECVSHLVPHHARDHLPVYVDVTFNPESKNLFISVVNSHRHAPSLTSRSISKTETLWSTTISKRILDKTLVTGTHKHKIEIGILDPRPSHEPNEFTLGGILAELGTGTDFEPVLFSFPSIHHISKSSSYKTYFKDPTGLHPKYHISITKSHWRHEEECKLYAWFTLPKSLFIDKYQLSDPQLLKSLNIHRVAAVHGETDLEAPTWTQELWGSDVLLELESSPSDGSEVDMARSEQSLEVEIPFHLRYLPPARGKTSEKVTMPWPIVFWACEEQSLNKIQRNPFERKELGWEFAFEGKDVVYHFLEPETVFSARPLSSLQVPILNLQHEWLIKFGTVGFVLVGFTFVVRLMLFSTGGGASRATERQQKGKEKKVQ